MGRLIWLRDQLHELNVNVSVEAVRKWFLGTRPRQEKCEALAQILEVDPIRLFMGFSHRSNTVAHEPRYNINLFWSDEDGCWIADVPDLRPCSAHGDTRKEAVANIHDAIEGWLEVAREKGFPIPRAVLPAGHLRGCLTPDLNASAGMRWHAERFNGRA